MKYFYEINRMHLGGSQDFIKFTPNSVFRQENCSRLESWSGTFDFKYR